MRARWFLFESLGIKVAEEEEAFTQDGIPGIAGRYNNFQLFRGVKVSQGWNVAIIRAYRRNAKNFNVRLIFAIHPVTPLLAANKIIR